MGIYSGVLGLQLCQRHERLQVRNLDSVEIVEILKIHESGKSHKIIDSPHGRQLLSFLYYFWRIGDWKIGGWVTGRSLTTTPFVPLFLFSRNLLTPQKTGNDDFSLNMCIYFRNMTC